MLAAVGVAVRFIAALLLLYAAARKIATPRPFRQTLEALRLPALGVVAVVVPLAEITAAVGLMAVPHSPVTVVLVVGLGLAFAGAAVLALVRGERIHCACLGQRGDSYLGVRQIAALPAWVGVAVVSLLVPDGGVSGVRPVAVMALTLAVAVTVRELVPRSRENRTYLRILESQ